MCSTCHSSSFIQRLPKVCSSHGERQELQRAGPIMQVHFKPLFRAYLPISYARSCQRSKPNISGVGNTLLSCGWRERECMLAEQYSTIFFHLPHLCSVSLDGQTSGRGCLHPVSPVPHLLFCFRLLQWLLPQPLHLGPSDQGHRHHPHCQSQWICFHSHLTFSMSR